MRSNMAHSLEHSRHVMSPAQRERVAVGSQIGRYEIVRHLATGGMCDVWLARVIGPAGFSKSVALKTLLPMYSASLEFVEMLIREASVAAKLIHPGIVQILDLGVLDGQYFIAME